MRLLSVILCDDERQIHEDIRAYAAQYTQKKSVVIQLEDCYSAEELIELGEHGDAVLLDIDMPGMDGKVLGKNMAFPEKIGMLIENPAFIDSYTGYDNLKMLASINKGEVDISRALETVGLNPQDKRKYRKYSLGMKQRLGIACAIMEEPKLLLLDEPFNALDKEGQEKLSEIIRDMRDKGSLILLSSHDKDELENLSDVIYLVDSGRFKLK